MKRGKHICETLKGIRREIAEANEIDYSPTPCTHEGDCAGTCPACEQEMRWLERQLRLRQSLGKAVTIAGLSLGAASLVGCNSCSKPIQPVGLVPYVDSTKNVVDTIEALEGEVIADPAVIEADKQQCEPQEIDGVTQPEDPNDNRPPR